MGGQAFREPVGLEARDGRRPDLQLVVNLQNIICDVVVSHPLNAGYIRDGRALRPVGVAMMRQRGKHDKYDHTAAQDTVSIAVQRGNSMTFLAGYSRAMTSRRDADQEE